MKKFFKGKDWRDFVVYLIFAWGIVTAIVEVYQNYFSTYDTVMQMCTAPKEKCECMATVFEEENLTIKDLVKIQKMAQNGTLGAYATYGLFTGDRLTQALAKAVMVCKMK